MIILSSSTYKFSETAICNQTQPSVKQWELHSPQWISQAFPTNHLYIKSSNHPPSSLHSTLVPTQLNPTPTSSTHQSLQITNSKILPHRRKKPHLVFDLVLNHESRTTTQGRTTAAVSPERR